MEKKNLMNDIKDKVDEILSHGEEISELHFDARLLNGTRFQFNYDDEEFKKSGNAGRRVTRQRISALNGVIDIIAAALAITLMIISCVSFFSGRAADAFMILTFAFFLVFFTESSVYHLMPDNHKRALRALYLVRHALLSLSLAAMTSALGFFAYSGKPVFLLSLVVLALSVFLSCLGTKFGTRVSALSLILYPVLMIVNVPASFQSVCLAAALTLPALLAGLLPDAKSAVIKAARTNGIFYLISLPLFYFTLEALL